MADNKIQVYEEETTKEKKTIEDLKAHIYDLENYIHDLMLFLPISLCTINPSNIIIDANKTLLKVSRYEQDELIGSKIYLLCKDQKNIESLIKNTVDNGFVNNHEMILLTKDKKPISVAASTQLRRDDDGDIVGYFVTFIDISKLKQMEEKLKEKVGQLEKNKIAMQTMIEDLQETILEKEIAKREVKNLNKNLEKKVEERTAEIDNLLKQKDELITRLGHDLKTPITILMNIIPLIDEEVDNPEAKKDCNTAIRNLIYIKNLVKEILKISEITSPAILLEKKEILLNELINEVLNDNKIIFYVKNITIQSFVNKPIIVDIDEMKIKEVLFNLLSNAVKFTQENGEIILKTFENKETVTVSITDNGIGMNKEQLQNIFNDFYKADTSRHNLDGSGLGLSICKRIIEKHGGKIWAESEGEQKGSTFYFKLPKKTYKEIK
ncbi:MAG: PAS domain-containing sensor histidine kinase [Thermoplasmatales archaeon]|nr:MAG: PAS domain-containing sensor histidine kinase [Thermoplasmatales archaeon]